MPRISIFIFLRLFVPWRQVGGVTVVACADPSPEFQRLAARLYGSNMRIVVTGKFDIIWTAQRLFRDRLNHDAVFRLDEQAPEFSARLVATARQKLFASTILLAMLGGFLAAPALAATLAFLLLGLCYLANIILRLLLFAAASIGPPAGTRVTQEEIENLNDADLPIYSILVPLYHEEHMVGRITAALKTLDCPGLMAPTPQTQNLASAGNFPNE